ncbi:MAG TPA: hypothetical protein VFD61_07425 [Gaiellales bacterium]|nr:hypothetical protein [Gaiellales bacterium]
MAAPSGVRGASAGWCAGCAQDHAAGVRRYHGEQHVYLVKRLNGADS